MATAEAEVFRKKMRFHRQQSDLTMQELADNTDVSLSTISEFERGARERVPKRPFIVALEKELGLRNGELLIAAGLQPNPADEYDPTAGTPLEQEVQDLFRKWYVELQTVVRDHADDSADAEQV